jgi:hypothetical protein
MHDDCLNQGSAYNSPKLGVREYFSDGTLRHPSLGMTTETEWSQWAGGMAWYVPAPGSIPSTTLIDTNIYSNNKIYILL